MRSRQGVYIMGGRYRTRPKITIKLYECVWKLLLLPDTQIYEYNCRHCCGGVVLMHRVNGVIKETHHKV